MADTDVLPNQTPPSQSDLSPIHFRPMSDMGSSCVPASPRATGVRPSGSSLSPFRDASASQPEWSIGGNLSNLGSPRTHRLSEAAPAISHCQRASSEGRASTSSLMAVSTATESGPGRIQRPSALRLPKSNSLQEASSSDTVFGAKPEGLRSAVLKSRVHKCFSLSHVRNDLNAGAARRVASPRCELTGSANGNASPLCVPSQKELHRCASDPVTACGETIQGKSTLPPLPLPFDDRRAVFAPARLSCLSPRAMPAKKLHDAPGRTGFPCQDKTLPAGSYPSPSAPCQIATNLASPNVRSSPFPAIRAYASLRIQTDGGNNGGADADEDDTWLRTCIPGLEEGSPKSPVVGSRQGSPQWCGQAGRRSAMKGMRSASSSCVSSPCRRVSFDEKVEVRVFERQRARERVGVKTTPRAACL